MSAMRWPAVVTLMVAITSCSSSKEAVQPVATPSPAASVDKARASKLANAGVLTSGDMRGWKVSADDAPPEQDQERFYSCVGAEAPQYVISNFGSQFKKGDLELRSGAEVAPSVAAAATNLQALKSAKAPACWKKIYMSEITKQGLRVQSMSVKSETVKITGADDVAVLHTSANSVYQGTPISFDDYQFVVLVGTTELNFNPSGYDVAALDMKTITSLARAVVKRVRAV